MVEGNTIEVLWCTVHVNESGRYTLIIFCVLYCKHQIVYEISLAYFLCLPEASVSGCGDTQCSAASCSCCLQILCNNVRGLARNLGDLTVASSQYDILLCSETLVSDVRRVSDLLVPGFGRPVLLCRGKIPNSSPMDGCIRRDGYGAFGQPKFERGCCEMLFFRVSGVRQNLYVSSLSRTLT